MFGARHQDVPLGHDLIRSEDPNSAVRASELEEKIHKWLAEWEAIFEPKRDANGELPADIAAAFVQGPAPVQLLRSDLSKITGF